MAELVGNLIETGSVESMPRKLSFLYDVANRVQERNGKMGMIDAARVGWNMETYKKMFSGDNPDLVTAASLSILEDARNGSEPKQWFFSLLMEQLPLLEESLAKFHVDGEKVLVSKQLAFKSLLTLYDYGSAESRAEVAGILERNIGECERLAQFDEKNQRHFLGFRLMQVEVGGEMAGKHKVEVMERAAKSDGRIIVIDSVLGNAEHFTKDEVNKRIKSLVNLLVFEGEYANQGDTTVRSRAIDDMTKSWLTIKYKDKELERVGGWTVLEHAVYQNIAVMNALRRHGGDNVVFGLNEKYGITHFGRYEPELLYRQWLEQNVNDKPFGVHIGCYSDWNGAFYKDLSILVNFDQSARNVGRRTIFVEARNKFLVARKLMGLHRKYNREIDFLILAGHGSPDSVLLGLGYKEGDYIDLQDLKKKATDKISKIYRKNIPTLFHSCSVGAKKGLAHGFSRKFDGQGIGPPVPTSVQSYKLGLNLDGRSNFWGVKYSKGVTVADYRGGELVKDNQKTNQIPLEPEDK